ncbi:hypothetical protein HHL22_04795 [Hymenobacter sp. RP-2-7]|uniref:Carboxypeptidase regulatory-like domain-containing protein n=1 Tax=Hymenobacter polaris TaxID=2682546 RepID=A0A7Y0FLK8_9BACT|nr:hypothetical protein [Hymenobacter polaris]NML64516.1 hypothetical protein [Hymenobacter polaris]
MRLLLLCLVSLFCVTCLVACENTAEPDQLTVVQGTVTSAETGRPLASVLMVIESFQRGIFGRPYLIATGDSVRTDRQGKYQLSFRNRKGLYYAATAEPLDLRKSSPYYRLAFVTNPKASIFQYLNSQEVTVGQTNTVDFQPNELRTVAVRIRNRNTGYQQLDFNYRYLHGNNLDTLAYLRGYYLPPVGVQFHYYQRNTAGQLTKDTAVALVVQSPAARPPDTLRATLTFGR